MEIEWNVKMKKMEEEGNLKKDIGNNHVCNVKYVDLEYLKAQNGPFTNTEEVIEFDQNTPESKEKNKRLYTEVRYAKKIVLINEAYCGPQQCFVKGLPEFVL